MNLNRFDYKDDIYFLNEKIRESKRCIINIKFLYGYAKLFRKEIYDSISFKYIKIINDIKYELDIITFVKKVLIKNIITDSIYSKLEEIIELTASLELFIVSQIKDLTAIVNSYSAGYVYYNNKSDLTDEYKKDINELVKKLKDNLTY